MEFGTFMEFPSLGAAADETAAFDRALGEVAAADRWGLDAVWLAELHGSPERSVLQRLGPPGACPVNPLPPM